MYQIQATGSYGAVTDQVRLYRNCSRRNLFWHKKQCYVQSSGPHTSTSYQDIAKNFQRSSNKDLEEDLTRSEGFNRISTTAFDKNLYKIMQGPLRGIHQDLYKSFSQGLHKRSWNLEAGPCTPELRPAFCVSLRNRNAHGHAHKSQLLCENLQQKCRGPMEHPDVTPALTPTVKAPAVWTHRRASPRSESTWASPPIDPREKSPAGKGRARELDTLPWKTTLLQI